MPGIRDDIIVKAGILTGNCKPEGGMLGVAGELAEELEDMGLLADAQPINQKLHKAYVHFRDTLSEAIDEMSQLIDDKLFNTPPTPPPPPTP